MKTTNMQRTMLKAASKEFSLDSKDRYALLLIEDIDELESHLKMKQDDWIAACKEIDELESENERMMECLKYYADYRNYSVDYETSHMGFSRRCILYNDIEERNEATGLAGRRARECLASLKPKDNKNDAD